MRGTRVGQLVAEKRRGARALQRLQGDPELFLATVQVGVSVTSTTAGAFGGASIAKTLEPVVAELPYVGNSADELSLVIVISVLSFLTLVAGELVPKSLALRSAEPYGLFVAPLLLGLAYLTKPAIWLLTTSSNLILRLFGDHTSFTEARHSPGELQQLVEEATVSGSVHPAVGEMASRAMEFGDLTVNQVMVPRQKVVGIAVDATMAEIKERVLEHGHTRMPVYEGVIDHLLGYVTLRDLVPAFAEDREIALRDVLRPPFLIPGTMKATELLAEMQNRRTPIAIVVDELGATSGIVTAEDLVEEIVGQIESEHSAHEPPPIVRETSGSSLVRGDLQVRDVNRELDLELPEGTTWTTLGGLCLELAGRIPSTGELFTTEAGVTLEIVHATPRHVEIVRVTPPEKVAEEAE